MTNGPVYYESMYCEACGAALLVEDAGGAADISCPDCGLIKRVSLANCRGPRCGARVFFGGKSGRSPINVATGSSHFYDCIDADSFRRRSSK